MMRSALKVLALWGGLSTTAFAGDLSASGGVGGVVNDPFLKRNLLSAGIQYRPESQASDRSQVAFGADLSFSPDLGEQDYKDLTTVLIDDLNIAPDISRINYAVRFHGMIFPGHYTSGDIETTVGFGASVGAVRTSDSLQALDVDTGNERAVVTQNQIHPCSGTVMMGEIWKGDKGLRLRMDQILYVEVVNATTLEMKNNLAVQIEAMVKL